MIARTETIRFTDFGAPVAIAAPRDIPASTTANGGLNVFYPCEP